MEYFSDGNLNAQTGKAVKVLCPASLLERGAKIQAGSLYFKQNIQTAGYFFYHSKMKYS